MPRNPYAPFILASMAMQLVTTLAFAATMVGLTIKLRHGPLRLASMAWVALTLLSGCWLLVGTVRAQESMAGYVLASMMTAMACTFAHLSAATGAALIAEVEAESTPHDHRPDHRRPVRWYGSLMIGAAIGLSGHYWTYNVAAPEALGRYLWLRSVLVLSALVALVQLVRLVNRSRHAARPLAGLLLGVAAFILFAVLDGAIRLSLAEGSAWPWLPVAAVSSAALGTFLLGVGFLVSALELERSHTRRSIALLDDALVDALERERLTSVGRLASQLAGEIHTRFSQIGVSLQRVAMSPAAAASNAGAGLAQAQDAVQRGMRLTSRLQQLAHQEPVPAGGLDLVPPTRALLNGVRSTLPPTMTLEFTAQGDARILGDPARYDQLLSNLVFNARDAMPAGGVLDVSLHTTSVEESRAALRGQWVEGPYVVLTVRDSGTGIAPELVGRMFEPFVSTKGERGTGLGLATVATIVAELQGALTLDTQPDQGSEFTVWLPAVHHPMHTQQLTVLTSTA